MRPATVWQENRTLTHHSVDRHMTDSCITRWRILSRFPLIFAEPAGQPFAPHCGKPQRTDDEPHRGKPNLERALNALLLTWARVARPAPGSTAKELAIALCRALQAQPELIGVRVYEQWINGTICSSARPSAWKGRRPTRAFFTNSKGKCPTNVMTCSSWASRGRPSRPIECLIRTRPWLPLSDEMGKRA